MPVYVDAIDVENRSPRNSKLREIFLYLGMKLIRMPSIVMRTMRNACALFHSCKKDNIYGFSDEHSGQTCVCIHNISPELAIDFFKSFRSELEDCFDPKRFKTILDLKLCLEYCLKTSDTKSLHGVRLLLRKDNVVDILQTENPLILSEYADLLPKSSDKFVHMSLVNISQLRSLSFEKLSADAFSKFLPESITPVKYKVQKATLMSVESPLSLEWLSCFWKFVDDTKDTFDLLKDWVLLPVNLQERVQIIPLFLCEKVLNYADLEQESEQELFQVFQKVNLPTPTLKSIELYKRMVKHRQIDRVLECFHFWKNVLSINLSKLSVTECVNLVTYLVKGATTKELKDKLKRLKIFISYEKEVVELNTSKYGVLQLQNKSLPMHGVSEIFCVMGMTVLEYFPQLWSLYEIIDCEVIDDESVYSLYVLPHFHLFGAKNRLIHLEYINDNLLHSRDVVLALQSVPFIPAGSIMKKAREFFNPDNIFFAVMCETSDFPPEPFNEARWRTLLMYAGMLDTVSEEHLLKFANSIAESNITDEAITKFKHLVDELFRLNPAENDLFYDKIAKIKFIPVKSNIEVYENIHPSLNTTLRFISFHGTISSAHVKLAWTSADILPQYVMPHDQKLVKRLHIVEEPAFDLVVKHIKNICQVFVDSYEEDQEKIIKDIMTDIYMYLSKHSEYISLLKSVNLVHVSKHQLLVSAKQIVKDISHKNEIVPHLIKAPEEYGAFFEMFRILGMTDDATVNTYSKILYEFHKLCGDSELSPTELPDIQNTLYGLMKSLETLQDPLDSLEIKELYLLSETNRLQLSSELYYDCLEIPRERLSQLDISFVADFKCIGINSGTLEALFTFLPEQNRPLCIRSLLSEELLSYNTVNYSETVMELYDILSSDSFINIVMRISKHDTSKTNELTRKDMQSISARLRRLRITPAKQIKTIFKSINEVVDDTKNVTEKKCFYDNAKELLYLDDDDMDITNWLRLNAIELERILRVVCYGKFKPGSLLNVFFRVDAFPDRIHDILTQINIPFVEDDILSKIWFPLPGTLVPRELYQYLRKPVKTLPLNQYAVVPCENEAEDNSYSYMYVVIKEIIDESSTNRKCYMVNAGKSRDYKIQHDDILEIRRMQRHSCSESDSESDNDENFLLASDHVPDEIDGYNTAKYARHFLSSGRPDPRTDIGHVWLSQAKYDLSAGQVTFSGIDARPFRGYNWVCLQCQQAAERAIKAAMYATNSLPVQRSHSLGVNVPKKDYSLSKLASSMSLIVGNINALRYPSGFSIPADRYSKEDASEALHFGELIIDHVDRVYFC